MKTITYNYDKLRDEDITRIVKRAKGIVRNSKNQILLACSNNNYHLPGGHLKSHESFEECLVREIKEETGVDIPLEKRTPILVITYYNRDYPEKGVNSKSIANYYEVDALVKPNYDKIKLTEDEKKGNFKIEYIDEDKILDFLNESLKTCTRDGVVKDTIEALTEYLNRRA